MSRRQGVIPQRSAGTALAVETRDVVKPYPHEIEQHARRRDHGIHGTGWLVGPRDGDLGNAVAETSRN